MTLNYVHVAAIILVYLGVLFAIAYSTERRWVPQSIVSHPVTYVFSLGIFASAWSFYGVIDLSQRFGFGALAYYIGTALLFLFSAYALKPLIELARRFQINSMADLLVFRYHSHLIGGLVTLLMLLSMAPLLALQLQAVADTIHLLTKQNSTALSPGESEFGLRQTFAFLYGCAIVVFAMLFGSNREHHRGLVTAMAFESLVKLCALLAIGLFALFGIFDGLDGLDTWLEQNPWQLEQLHLASNQGSVHALMLVFIATAVSMPHIFHITVVENQVENSNRLAMWAMPLFLLLLALPVFPILWAGHSLNLTSHTEYFPLTVPMATGSETFAIVAFLGGISASTGAMIAITLALATMILNHWILPIIHLRARQDFYGQLLWMRRILIALVLAIGYGFYALLNNRLSLTELALISFIGALQLLPGVLGVAHWSGGNRRGFFLGMTAGCGLWFFCLFMPVLFGVYEYDLPFTDTSLPVGPDQWQWITIWSCGLNTILFLVGSLWRPASQEEAYSAELCASDELSHPVRMALDIRSPADIIERLSTRIGSATAGKEVERALTRLNLTPNESRPYALRRLRDEIEANLSSLMGISMASEIMDRLVPFKVPEIQGATDINLMESRLGQVRDHLTGLAAELNNLRLYHRRTLEELPLATCSIGQDMEVLMWNSAMTALTGITKEDVVGSHLENVLAPWGYLLTKFALSPEPRFYKRKITLNDKDHWITLHKAFIPSSLAQQVDGQVIILEDVTELQMLEQELVHSERLASVGRLAAGVAHEIGNPVTGIACLAQNMAYETENKEVLESADQILSLTDRVTRIVQSLVSFSHAGKQKDQQFDLVSPRECAQEAVNLLSLQKQKDQIQFVNRIPEQLELMADSQRLIQVFINLLSNARDASDDGDEIVIEAEEQTAYVVLSVTDNGAGISEKEISRIFEPFYTTKDPGEGTGLGLAMVYSIIEDHKGTIEIQSPVDKTNKRGTRFVVTVPKTLATTESKSNTSGSSK